MIRKRHATIRSKRARCDEKSGQAAAIHAPKKTWHEVFVDPTIADVAVTGSRTPPQVLEPR
jgi:hypothetical protein